MRVRTTQTGMGKVDPNPMAEPLLNMGLRIRVYITFLL